MNMKAVLSICLFALFVLSCEQKASNIVQLSAENLENELLETLAGLKDGTQIELPEGTYEFKRSLVLSGLKDISIRGAGAKKTILSFAEQIEGAEGLNVKDTEGIQLIGFSVHDSKGDAIKVLKSQKVVMKDLEVSWTNGASSENGAYGLYPVSCDQVLMENCEASFAMDAGIYVGQSKNIIVRNCIAHHNVAGIEIENCSNGEVYANKAINNTGGLLILDMPDIPVANGERIIVRNNEVKDNNHLNFSEPGTVVNILPPGTGMLIMAHTAIDVYENTVSGHHTLGLGIVSWLFTGKPIKSKDYVPFCSAFNIHDNSFESTTTGSTDTTTSFGQLLTILNQGQYQDVIFDGIIDPTDLDEKGIPISSKRICISNNGEISFVNLNAGMGTDPQAMAQNMNKDIGPFDCTHPSITLDEFKLEDTF